MSKRHKWEWHKSTRHCEEETWFPVGIDMPLSTKAMYYPNRKILTLQTIDVITSPDLGIVNLRAESFNQATEIVLSIVDGKK